MACTYDAENHTYEVDGRRVPSVTEIAGLLTARKYAETNPAILAQAQRRGTEVHELCEAIDCGIDPAELEIAPELVGYVNAYLAFLRDYRPTWDYIEKIVCTQEYAGRADRIGKIDGKPCIVDIKTTANMDRLSKLSLAFQLYFYNEAFYSGFADTLYGVQLKKDGTYTAQDYRKIISRYGVSVVSAAEELLNLTQLIGGYSTT